MVSHPSPSLSSLLKCRGRLGATCGSLILRENLAVCKLQENKQMPGPYFRMLRHRLPRIVTTALTFAMMSSGVLFAEEFGDPLRNQTEFQNLLSYSPLHNIRVPNGTHQYPATLLTVGKHRLCHAHHPKSCKQNSLLICPMPVQSCKHLLIN